jgi:hypothetical protein
MTKTIQAIIAAGLVVVFGVIVWLLVANFKPSPRIDVEPDGTVVAKIVDVRLEKVADLRVLHLTGTVQAKACVTWWMVLNPCRVFKAPAAVDYFVDTSKLDLSDFRWNAGAKTLLITAPDVRIGSVNIDTSAVLADQTDGMLVPRKAMAELQKRSSASALAVARREAEKPANMEAARRNARTALESLFAKPLRAAGVRADVQVRFAGEARPSSERWDMSRSLDEVLGKSG